MTTLKGEKMNHKYFKAKRQQMGVTLIEIAIATAVILILAIISIPFIGTYVIKNKAGKVGEELQSYVADIKANAQGSSVPDYSGVTVASLIGVARNSSAISTDGTSVFHGLNNGSAPGKITITNTGDTFTITAANVNDAACPGLPSVLQRTASSIVVDGTSIKTTAADGSISVAYNAGNASAACTTKGVGDIHTFAFTVR